MKARTYIAVGLAAILFAFMTSCSAITETGNPCQGGECVEAFAPGDAAGKLYENETFGVNILYPENWTYEEAADQSSVDFMSELIAGTMTTAFISFEILDPAPESLFAFLAEEYPNRNFTLVLTSTLTGYLYDNPESGPHGGDLREYFFLAFDLLIHIEAEIFASTQDEFVSLIEGITVP